jgi:hypothetical protein
MKILLLIICAVVPSSYACDIYRPDQFNFSTSIINTTFFAYKNNGDESFIPFFRANNCGPLASKNKFLMISFGPQNQELSDRIRSYDIANQTRDSGCKIINAPFKDESDYSSRRLYLAEKWKAIKSCYRIVVKDETGQPLKFPEKQPGCEYTFNFPNVFEFNGGYCFFSPTDSSSYHVSFRLKDECLNYEGLRNLKITVADFQAALNFYSAGDPSGTSLDLTALKSFALRFHVAPNQELIQASDSFGLTSPQYPQNYYLPDTHLGKPEVTKTRSGKTIVRVPLWADNRCQEICSNGFCQGLCDYSQPLAGEINLREVSQKGKVIIESGMNWFQGGVILPRYQGEISGMAHELSDEGVEIGKTYRITMSFNDPKFDFQSYKKEYQHKIQRTTQGLPSIGSSTIPTIPQLGSIGSTPSVPEILEISGINFSARLNSVFEAQIDSFESFFQFKYWPPHFNKICHERCHPIEDKYLVLSLDFRVNALDEETGSYDIDVLRIGRTSNLLGGYERFSPLMPKISCKRNTN